jgi:hypothetical protein
MSASPSQIDDDVSGCNVGPRPHPTPWPNCRSTVEAKPFWSALYRVPLTID